jgi:predicted transcriptional regulator
VGSIRGKLANMNEENDVKDELLSMTAEIVAAHASNNPLTIDELPQLIREVYHSLAGISQNSNAQDEIVPAVPINKSITADYLICLEDGRKLKMMKRHLMTAFGLTPEQYRVRWNLPTNYPMVAPNYAEHRRKLARNIGLGKRR